MFIMMNRGGVFMKTKEARRLFVVEQVSAGKITVQETSERLELSCREIIRLKGRFRKEGAKVLASPRVAPSACVFRGTGSRVLLRGLMTTKNRLLGVPRRIK